MSPRLSFMFRPEFVWTSPEWRSGSWEARTSEEWARIEAMNLTPYAASFW